MSTYTAFHSCTEMCADAEDTMCSLSESKADKMMDAQHGPLVAYTRRHLVKTYPGGLRTDSSNMMPIPHWMAGVQCGECLQTCIFVYNTQ